MDSGTARVALFILAGALCAAQPDSLASDTAQAVPDSGAVDAETQERAFQDDMNTLFRPDSTGIDTALLDTDRINVARFDYRQMEDTVAIVLQDSLQDRFYVHPVQNVVTSPFGLRRYFWHYGMDIRVKRRDTIRCAFDGIVRVIQNDRYGYGKVVVVRHQKGLETLYGHLSRCKVERHQRVKAGEVIGLGGRTGHATACHLHFEVRYCGEPFDPAAIIDFENYALKSDTLRLSKADFEYLSEARSILCHVIRKGDYLGKIARHYGTTVRKLCRLNGMRSTTLLRIGRKLVIRAGNVSAQQPEGS